MALSNKIRNFYRRWNVELDEKAQFHEFKNRTINSLVQVVGPGVRRYSDQKRDELDNEFLSLIGETVVENSLLDAATLGWRFANSMMYVTLAKQRDFKRYLLCLQALFWMESLGGDQKLALDVRFREDIACSGVQVRLRKTKNGFLFYPAGAKLLDRQLVDDVLDWLEAYPVAHTQFQKALLKYGHGGFERNLLDDLRFSLEDVVKNILGNQRSLENQKTELCDYITGKGVPPEVRNMYWQLLSYLTTYQNRYVKHNERVHESEIEFILYLTGTFIRFLMVLCGT